MGNPVCIMFDIFLLHATCESVSTASHPNMRLHVKASSIRAEAPWILNVWHLLGEARCFKASEHFLGSPKGRVPNWMRQAEQGIGGECIRGWSTSSPSTNQVQDKCQALERPGSEMKIAVDSPKCQLIFVSLGKGETGKIPAESTNHFCPVQLRPMCQNPS